MAKFSEKRLKKALKNAPEIIYMVGKHFGDGDDMAEDLEILVEAAGRYEGLMK